jgi:transcriptional regulator with XRE-family HTH domain
LWLLDLGQNPQYIRSMHSTADFGQAVVFLADKAGMNQKQLASALEVSYQTVTNWKGGQEPMAHTVQKLPAALGCTLAEIEEVAAYHHEWREILKDRKRQAAGITENAALGTQVAIENMEREILRNAALTLSQLLGFLRHLATGAPDRFPIRLPPMPPENRGTSRTHKPTT